MQKRILIIVFIVFAFGLFAEELTGTVYWVSDGDTFIMGNGSKLTRIRIWGIDAPEKQLTSGSIATAILKAFIEGKRVTCLKKGEHADRIVAQVFYQKKDVALELLKMGAVWWSDKYAPDQSEYKKAFEESVKTKRGLWAWGNPEKPWLWRKKQKLQNNQTGDR